MKSHENLAWNSSKVEAYVKQINDLWLKPNQQHFRKYFEDTKGYFIMGTGSGIGKRKIKDNLFPVSKEIIKQAIPKIKKRLKNKS